jgi:hypothetical protein
MCDYSLEMYRSRPAVKGERYETRRFASGSIGFASPGDPETAVCMACDTSLELAQIPPHLQLRLGLPASAVATFVRIEDGPHHDGIRFANGAEVTLQQLGPGVAASVVDALTGPPSKPARQREMEKVF